MTLLDIIIFLLIGAFIVSRFMGFDLPTAPKNDKKNRNKSGTKKSSAKKSGSSVLDFPKSPKEKLVVGGEDEGTYTELPMQKPAELTGLDAIKAADASFTEKEFIHGAMMAYHFYYEQYNKKDDEALGNLLAPILLNDLVDTFNTLDKKNHTPDIKVEKIDKAVIADARLNGKTILIDVQFTAKQAENTLTKTGKYVGSKKKPAKTIKSLWTFARPAGSEDPNWDVQSIQRAS